MKVFVTNRKITLSILMMLVVLGVQTVGYSQAVSIPDPNLAAAIRQEIGNSITRQTLLNLRKLEAPNRGIKNLTGLEHARNLQHLNLGREYIDGEGIVNSNAISDFSPLTGLTQLTSLRLGFCGLSDVSFLSNLRQLTFLELIENSISDISPLAKLTQLNQLYLWDNNISDISPLAELKKLTYLELSSNSISDISALAELKKLTGLTLMDSNISDISPLAELKQLYGLQLDENTISDISPLVELTGLEWLSIRNNSISDVAPLANLKKLTELSLEGNNISDVSPLIKLNLTGTEWDSTGLYITGNPLSYASINTHIPAMQAKGIEVAFDNRTPTTLHKISGIAQQGIVNTALPLLFVVEVLDEQNRSFSAVPVTFTITAGRGRLSATRTTTDTTGRATAHLTMGRTADTTTVRASAADISQSVQFTATAVLRSAPVPIPDPDLHAKIAETLRKPLGATLTFADMLKLRTLTANSADIYDLTGIQYASNLTSLSLNNNSISDVSPLASLAQLTTLNLMNNQISNVVPLAGLTRLTTLNLRDNRISDVAPLTSLALQRLYLQGNALSDTSIQAHIPRLQAAGGHVRFDDRTLTQSGPIVRLIYFLPRDRQPQSDINAKLDALIKEAQQVYAGQLDHHGFGRKTFTFETDPNGKAVVYRVQGLRTDEYYNNLSYTWDDVWKEIDEHFDRSKNIYLTVIDISNEVLDSGGVCGRGGGGTHSGNALMPASGGCFNVHVTAHELGHTFGLQHDFRSNAEAERILRYTTDPMVTSSCAAEWCAVHRAFSPNQITSDTRTTVEMLPPRTARGNAIRFRFKVTDADGLHQVQFLTPEVDYPGSLLACKELNGITSRTIEFVTTELRPKNESVYLQVIDVHGNYTASQNFPVDVSSLLPPERVVSIPDRNLAAAIRGEVGNSITTHTLLDLIRLDVSNREITDLTGLEHARNLRELNLGGEYNIDWEYVNSNTISDYSPLARLANLRRLNLSQCALSDISFLSGLTQLTELYLNDNIISDVSPLAKLTKLTELNLNDNIISDVSPLAKLTKLTSLNIFRNTISDISAFAELKKLTYLEFSNNTISDISALAELKQLTYLEFSNNTISDISALAELKQLSSLYILDNIISDISPLAELKQLYGLQLDGNTISDISPLAELTGLGWLAIRNNIISDVSPLAKLTKLTDLSLGGNNISDVSPLAKLTKLTSLDLSNNNISDVSPLVKLNLRGTEWDSTGLYIRWNPLSDTSINTHILAMQARGITVAFADDEPTMVDTGPKIEGPWLWIIVPTKRSGASAAASGIDFLSQMSGGTVTELKIATEGATEGAPVGNSVWTLHKLSPTGGDNINDTVNAAGLGTGDIDNHVAYGTIALDAPREQRTQMFAGSDDAVKVWLNGELVHNNPVDRGASDFQDQFPVTLKAGPNILLVAVYEGWGAWTGFFGFASDAEYTVTTGEVALPAWDVNEDGITDATDVILVTAALGQQQPKDPRLDVNGDGVVDAKDLALVVEHLGEGDAPAGPSHPALPLGFTLERVEHTLSILHAADDGTLTFKRGIANLERLLMLFVPEETALLHNYPNPFNPETWIPYQLSKPASVTLTIYDIQGHVVRALDLGHQPAGVYRIRSRAAYWDGRNAVGESVASGLYFYTLTAGDFTATRKMLVRK